MGLDCSHNAFHGAYSAFNSFRQAVAEARGCRYPPHFVRNRDGSDVLEPGKQIRMLDMSMDQDMWYTAPGMTKENSPGIYEFLSHSDCDGEISPEMCLLVASELEPLLDKMPDESSGHIAARGGYREVLRLFIEGCRAAAAEGVPLDFH